jgi:uncharacterized protein
MDAVSLTRDWVKGKMEGDASGHDWQHVCRVYRMSLWLYEAQRSSGAQRMIVQLAALLHDIADWKFTGGDETAGPEAAAAWLGQIGVDPPTIGCVKTIIAQLSFKGAGVPTPMTTIEGQIVQDADRLDALGAVGIARAFAYGGYKQQPMFDPADPPKLHVTAEAYKTSHSTTINHFFEKLLLLPERMNTAAAKRIAEQRRQLMITFLDHFFSECGADVATYVNRLLRWENE